MNVPRIRRLAINLALFLGSAMVLAGCGTNSGSGSSPRQMGGSIQGTTLNSAAKVSTIAGRSALLSPDGTGTDAQFNSPESAATDGTNLYVADTTNNTIRKIVIATGAVTTLAGSTGVTGSTDGGGTAALFNSPEGIAIDTAGTNLYVSDTLNNTVRKVVIATGAVTTLAGSATATGSTNGTGAAALFNSPEGLTTDGTNLYVAEAGNNMIRKIVLASGVVTTLAGSATTAGSLDGTGVAALFNSPEGIVIDPAGANLYVADTVNNTIRKIVITSGVVTTIAGSPSGTGSTDGIGASALFKLPEDLATDGTNLYVVDTYNNTIRKVVIATGAVTTMAGSAGAIGSTDGIGVAAQFDHPEGITNDGTNLYVADAYNNTIRKVAIATGAVTTLAGSNPASNGTGSAARFNSPESLTTDGTNLYVADTYNSVIRKVVIATGVVTTLAGNAAEIGSADGIGTAAQFNSPAGITTDGKNLYVADSFNNTIRKIVIATGAVTTVAGTPGVVGTTDGTGAAALFNSPQGITTDGTNLYVADTGNNTIRKVTIATGAVTTLAGTAGVAGSTNGTGGAALFSTPEDITTDGINLYVADTYNYSIRKIVIATGAVTTLAGTASSSGSTDGTGSAALFNSPEGITTDGINLYVTDTMNNSIRKVVIATGAVTTLAGTSTSGGSQDGTGSAALFNSPEGITTDGINLYVADTSNNTIRLIQ